MIKNRSFESKLTKRLASKHDPKKFLKSKKEKQITMMPSGVVTVLDGRNKENYETFFGVSLPKIKIHRTEKSILKSKAYHAHSYAQGNNIYLGKDVKPIDTVEGQTVIAHEITHILQQKYLDMSSAKEMLDPSVELERKAQVVEDRVRITGGIEKSSGEYFKKWNVLPERSYEAKVSSAGKKIIQRLKGEYNRAVGKSVTTFDNGRDSLSTKAFYTENKAEANATWTSLDLNASTNNGIANIEYENELFDNKYAESNTSVGGTTNTVNADIGLGLSTKGATIKAGAEYAFMQGTAEGDFAVNIPFTDYQVAIKGEATGNLGAIGAEAQGHIGKTKKGFGVNAKVGASALFGGKLGFGIEFRKDDDKEESSPIVKKVKKKQEFSEDFIKKYKENPYHQNPFYNKNTNKINPIGIGTKIDYGQSALVKPIMYQNPFIIKQNYTSVGIGKDLYKNPIQRKIDSRYPMQRLSWSGAWESTKNMGSALAHSAGSVVEGISSVAKLSASGYTGMVSAGADALGYESVSKKYSKVTKNLQSSASNDLNDATKHYAKSWKYSANSVTQLVNDKDVFSQKNIDKTVGARDLHYGRDQYNYEPLREKGVKDESKWMKLSKNESVFHTNDEHDKRHRDNKKYVSTDGHFEAVYDKEGNLVTDEANRGTYNYFSPKGISGIGHVVADVLPYYIWGNSEKDPTTFSRKMELTGQSIYNKFAPKEKEPIQRIQATDLPSHLFDKQKMNERLFFSNSIYVDKDKDYLFKNRDTGIASHELELYKKMGWNIDTDFGLKQREVNKKLATEQKLSPLVNTFQSTLDPIQNKYNQNELELDKKSGFYIDREMGMTALALERLNKQGEIEHKLIFRGTEQLDTDIGADLSLAERQTEKFFDSKVLDNYMTGLSKEKNFNSLELLGHSKGGGEAQRTALYLGENSFDVDRSKISAITHNPHGLNKQRAEQYAQQQEIGTAVNVFNFRNKNEIVGEFGQVLGKSIYSKYDEDVTSISSNNVLDNIVSTYNIATDDNLNFYEKYQQIGTDENIKFVKDVYNQKLLKHSAIHSIDPNDIKLGLNMRADNVSTHQKNQEYIKLRNLDNYNTKTTRVSSINDKYSVSVDKWDKTDDRVLSTIDNIVEFVDTNKTTIKETATSIKKITPDSWDEKIDLGMNIVDNVSSVQRKALNDNGANSKFAQIDRHQNKPSIEENKSKPIEKLDSQLNEISMKIFRQLKSEISLEYVRSGR